MHSLRRRLLSGAGVLVAAGSLLTLGSCTDYIVGAPPNSTITVIVNPPFIVANGGVSVITAIVMEATSFGTPVPDGTVVQFFTTLGRIDDQVKTKNGVAKANLVSDNRSGTANITVISGGITGSCSSSTSTSNTNTTAAAACAVLVGSALPKYLILVADPAVMGAGRTSYLTANVFDENGNPVANVPVFFSITDFEGSVARETLASGGQQRFTDSNGQAFDEVNSREPYPRAEAGARSVTVKATCPAAKGALDSDDVKIPIK
jgi:hypothetical protein